MRENRAVAQVPKFHSEFQLSVVMPVYNEAGSVLAVIKSLLDLNLPALHELIVVNDGSTDSTLDCLANLSDSRVIVVNHAKNEGKGAAVRTGLTLAGGSHLLIFDADDEYDAQDIPRLCRPLQTGRAEVVYGVRRPGDHSLFPTLIHAIGNRLMTAAANVMFGSAIRDLHTCLKLLPIPLLKAMRLREKGFGLDTEISAEMLRLGFRPFEVPISYVGRSKAEGKKIRFADSIVCIWVLCKVRLRGRTSYANRNRSLADPFTELHPG